MSNDHVVIPDDIDVVFVSDAFSHQHVGGAELTTDAIIEGSPLSVFRLNSRDVTPQSMSTASDKFWIFGNFFTMDLNLIPVIVANLHYAIVEYDYKMCKYRSPEKHFAIEDSDCDCHENIHGKMISAFFSGAEHIFWMGEKQRDRYHERFPFLESNRQTVLSSVFSQSFFDKIDRLNLEVCERDSRNDSWIIIGSNSWIKGAQEAEELCNERGYEYEVVWNISHDDILGKLSTARGLVFLPLGGDTCPRIVIEAKLLRCELLINDNVEHQHEEWFKGKDLKSIELYLRNRPDVFWKNIESFVNRSPAVSGYTTTLNCIDQVYPFEQSIASMLEFCDQVVVVDGGSKDGTWERLLELSVAHPQLLVNRRERDWNHKRFAVFDGLQKAYSRSLCTGEFCWQQDSDEIVHEDDYEKIRQLVRQVPKNMNLIALPVIEYWGDGGKVRVDVNPWKWRLSRNRKHITHGIPSQLRREDSNGDLYAHPGTDGCDYIDANTYDVIPCANFYTNEVHKVREAAMSGNISAIENYENWLNNVITTLPGVHHYSWYNLERKIRTYRGYWSKHWQSLYDIQQDDTAENNMFFDKPWADISDSDIADLASRLGEKMGGWVFHQKIDFSNPTPHIDCERDEPEIMKNRF